MEWIRHLRRFLTWKYHFPRKGSIAYQLKYSKPGDKIFIKSGKYSEDLTLKEGVDLGKDGKK